MDCKEVLGILASMQHMSPPLVDILQYGVPSMVYCNHYTRWYNARFLPPKATPVLWYIIAIKIYGSYT